jgi:putative SOS response-associated peptidase YedK
MCGRYTLHTTDELEDRYRVEVSDAIRANYNVAPSQTMPVITQDGLRMMRWGLIPKWAKDEKIGYKLINARSETVFEKPMWKGIIKQRRCLIPANGFYEWQKSGKEKQPFYIHLKDDSIFSFAGLWETWEHKGKTWETYSILTTTPNNEMESIHDRMPVILHKDDEAHWLAADSQEDIEVLLRPYTNGKLETYEVSSDVNTIKLNNNTLIGAINSK